MPKLTDNMLKTFVTLDSGWADVSKTVFFSRVELGGTKCDAFYQLELDDIYTMLCNLKSGDYKGTEILYGWWDNLKTCLFDNLGIDVLFPDGPQTISMYRMTDVPGTESEMLKWVLHHMSVNFDIMYEEDFPNDLNKYLSVDGLIKSIDEFWNTEDFDAGSVSPLIKKDFMMQWDNNLLLQDADEYVRSLFREYTDYLSDEGDFDALRIKAYACYGGNTIYECDWAKSAELLERLWKDYSFGYAANTLGYIYYYGRLTGGKPDYKKAFFYYSVGSTYEITESKYKLADMFIKGQYVAKNRDLGKHIIEKLYNESRYHFEMGENDTNFADIALRMGNIIFDDSQDPLNVIFAYKFYLQANFAITSRMKNRDFWGDKNVLKNIEDGIAKTSGVVKHYKASYKGGLPFNIFDLISGRGYCMYELAYKKLKNNRIKLTVTRKNRGNSVEKSIVTYPQFGGCEITDSTFVVAQDVDRFDLIIEDCGIVFFDSMDTIQTANQKDTIVFFCDGVPLLKIHAASYKITKPKDLN